VLINYISPRRPKSLQIYGYHIHSNKEKTTG
jgi:hypothetical protein